MGHCLGEDELLELARGGGDRFREEPAIEEHLADCATCSAWLAALLDMRASPEVAPPAPRWGGLVGRVLGPYRLDTQIGAGGMGAVYRAWDERLGRNVAVKVLPGHAPDSNARAGRLRDEARAAAAVAHPNVVAVYDIGTDDGITFIACELVRGESLRSMLESRHGRSAPHALPLTQRMRLGLELARGLAAVHAQGIVHCDLKPENLMVTEDGTLKILDFGLAKIVREAEREGGDGRAWMQGTVGYMAPEQARGEPADARSDIFAVGAILYEMATGKRAVSGESHAERMASLLNDAPPPADAEELAPIGAVIARCLERDPRRRFHSAHDLAWVLDGHAPATPARQPSIARRRLLLGAAATGLAGLAAGAFMIRRPAHVPPAFRQLTFRHGGLWTARFTRDGGSILYGAAWEDEPLTGYTLRLDGGTARPLDVASADVLAVSSRGDVALCIGKHYVEGQCATGRLAVMPLSGGAPRMLMDDVQAADFAPNGVDLAIVRYTARGSSLESPLGRVLVETASGWLTHPRISPDGKHVACMMHPSPQDDRGDVILVDTASGKRRTLSADWASAAGLAWDPSGDALWFSAARDDANNAVRMVTLGGREWLVARMAGRLRVHDVAQDGRVAVSLDQWRLRTLVAAVGSMAHESFDRSLSEFSSVVDRSADGHTLLLGEFGVVEATLGVYLRSITGGAPIHLGPGIPIALSPSGKRVAAVVPGHATPLLVYLDDGAERPALSLGAISEVRSGRWLDENALVVVAGVKDREPRLWRIDVGHAAPKPLTEEGIFGHGETDPARQRFAFVDREGTLRVVDVHEGRTRVVPGAFARQSVCGWLEKGDTLVVRNRTTPIVLTGVDAASGDLRPLGEIHPPRVGLKGVDSVVIDRDGGAYAYSYGQELSQLFLMSFDAPRG
ncbi:serine/threonine-protein kinase [Pendulispora rubella]|uniref:Serine/threonine-protein kinase n=1 Tax=Pendulispora rubella TaxID=2741070 RepID=A0ABZ2L687_9BACT